jgi:phosphoglucomutase
MTAPSTASRSYWDEEGKVTGRLNPLAGKPAPPSILVDVPRLMTAYYKDEPDPGIASQRVSFGTSGHRGSAFDRAFNEAHILAMAQAVCDYRRSAGIDGPLFLGMDTHALSEAAFASALEVFAANEVETMIDSAGGYTPTPAISHAIVNRNRGRRSRLADGIVVSPSHNPPEDGGFKYNPPNGGPADVDVTGWIERAANEHLENGLVWVRRVPIERARSMACVHTHDYVARYVDDLAGVVDMDAIRASGIAIGIDPLGGASVHYWPAIIDRYGIAATVVSDLVDPTFRFMTVDWDGKIRMDCSSPCAMQRLVGLRGSYDIAFANDTDADRHGIVCPTVGLMSPNHFLVAAIAYLFRNRPDWPAAAGVGKTVVSSVMIDRVTKRLGRELREVPVGFKWFSGWLGDGSVGFAGEESAGASFLRREGSTWTTDKDGLVMGLLAAEMTARTGKDPSEIYDGATAGLGTSYYERIDAPASPAQKAALKAVTPGLFAAQELAGEPIEARLVSAPANDQPIGGIKVIARNGWFAARPSGTEAVYKIYAESLASHEHLLRIQREAKEFVASLERQAGHAA